MNFSKRLAELQSKRNSLLCIGLDVDPGFLPQGLSRDADGVFEFNRRIIDATQDHVCAYKLNLAFYESLGERGWVVMRKTVEHIPDDVLTIGDGKRGDIGNTAERYAKAIFEDLKFDATTVNPYMGFDSVEPFLRDDSRGVFVLTLTSNPSSKDFQRVRTSDRPLFERVARAAKKWDKAGNIGLVVGATHPREMKMLRSIVPGLPFLIPGVGAQGGDLRAAVRYGCTKSGFGAVINIGRSILFASQGPDFADAARVSAMKLKDRISAIQSETFSKQTK